MNDLLREHAPISAAAWKEIDAEATRTLKTLLAARRLVDFNGPLGWAATSVPTGRTEKLSPLQEGAVSRRRTSLSLMELRVPFEVAREELDAIGRGARDADLDPVRNAARAAGIAETLIASNPTFRRLGLLPPPGAAGKGASAEPPAPRASKGHPPGG